MSSNQSWTFQVITDLISVLLACLLYCTTRGFFSGMGVSLPDWVFSLVAAMVDICLGDGMSILHLFSTCNW